MKNTIKSRKGITLVALVITIIVLLILAGVTLSGLLGDSGIIENSLTAKEKTEIANEKEIIQNANTVAVLASKTGKITTGELENALKENGEENSVTLIENGDTKAIKFNKTERWYELYEDGKIEGPKSLGKDTYAGDLSKGGKYNGEDSAPFKITCIEDLVAFSIMTNGGKSALGLASTKFTDQCVELTKDLDFKSIFSYNDYTTTIYGDLNKDGITEDIKTELTKKETNCMGFTGITKFNGIFNGNNKKIDNIYINTSKYAGLFATIEKATIKNLEISGDITSTGQLAGGIVSYTTGELEISNCINRANVTSVANQAGGILGSQYKSGGEIVNCANYGDISAKEFAGGIVGIMHGQTQDVYIYNCYNQGEIYSRIKSVFRRNNWGFQG